MNILLLCNKSPYPSKDGGSIATSAMSEGFAKHGHKVSILAINTPKHHTNEAEIKSFLPENVDIKLIDVNTKLNIFRFFRNLFFSDIPYNAERFYSKNLENELVELLKASIFDVIQIEGLYMSFYVPKIREYSKAFVSYRAHNIESDIWFRSFSGERNLLKKWYVNILYRRLKKFETAFLNQYDVLVPITKVDGEKLQNMGNIKPVLVTPASFDPQKILYEPDSVRYPSVFFIGALDWTPNQEGLFWFVDKVWPLVKKQRNDIEFTVAGRNAPSWLIRKLKKRKINFMGEVEDSQKFMNTFAVMIVPLFAGSGMRVKIAEGMLLGKAIVTTTLGTEGIETTHEENIMIADSIWDFSESVLQLISKRDFYDSISKKARLFALNYNQNSMNIEELLNFYNSSKI